MSRIRTSNKLAAGTMITLGAFALTASPALAHLCQNESKQPGAGAYGERELPNGKTAETGAWADLGYWVGPACEGEETHARVFLHRAASVGGDQGIGFISDECRDALFEHFAGTG